MTHSFSLGKHLKKLTTPPSKTDKPKLTAPKRMTQSSGPRLAPKRAMSYTLARFFLWIPLAVFIGQSLFAFEDSGATVSDPFDEASKILQAKEARIRCDISPHSQLLEKLQSVESLNQSTLTASQNTLLHLAIKGDCAEVSEWLLEHGADWHIRNGQRLNAFDVAVQGGNTKILTFFTEKLSGAPVSHVASKTKIQITPLEIAKKSQFDVKVGFSIANVSNEQLINLNGALKGLYRIDSQTVFKGRSEVFYARAESEVTTFRYLVEGKLLRENLLQYHWNGALNLKAEGYPDINTVDIASMVDKTWSFLDKTLNIDTSVGPGVRYIARNDGHSDVEPIFTSRQGLKWKPKKDLGFLKGGHYTLSEDWTYTDGRSGYSSVFEVSGKHDINDQLAAGITYKYWRNSLLDKDIDDSQILFELIYQSPK